MDASREVGGARGPEGLRRHAPPVERSLAAEAVASGRPALARSFRLHRPRGAFCARGWCRQCPVRGHGGEALACTTRSSGVSAFSPPDVLRAVARIAERWPPWFYETRFLRPRALRQVKLAVLRRLSAAGRLPAMGRPPARWRPTATGASRVPDRPLGAGRLRSQSPWPAAPLRELRCEVLVVGGGVAGLTAASVLAEAGAHVTLVEAEALGGSARFVPDAAEAVPRLQRRARGAGVLALDRTTLLGLYREEGIAAAIGPDGPIAVRLDRLVVATGAYDRPLAVPGGDLPGVVGIRGFERLARQGAFRPRHRIAVYAGPDEAGRAIRAAEWAGLRPGLVAGPAGLAGTATLLRVLGRRRVRGVELAPGGRVPCDVLVLGFTQPTFELQVQAGGTPRLAGNPPVIVVDAETDLPVLVVGEAAGAPTVEDAARRAEEAARAWSLGEALPPPVAPPVLPVAPPHPDAFVCWCEDVRVRDVAGAAEEGFGDIELVKRRSGAATGPCQGKLCLAELCGVLAPAEGVPVRLPTVRPPLRPVALADLAGAPGG